MMAPAWWTWFLHVLGRTTRLGKMNLHKLQWEHGHWLSENFPNATLSMQFDKLVEEVGELAAAKFERESGTKDQDAEHLKERIADAVADIVITLAGLCNVEEIDFAECVSVAWDVVKKRNWKDFPATGHPATSRPKVMQAFDPQPQLPPDVPL